MEYLSLNYTFIHRMAIDRIDIEEAERLRFTYAKQDIMKLRRIYEKYNPSDKKKCNCQNVIERKVFRQMFFEWFDNAK